MATLILAILAQTSGDSISVWTLIAEAGLMVKFVMLVLAIFSVTCWAIIALKFIQLRKAQQESKQFIKSFWAGESLDQVKVSTKRFEATPLAFVFRAGIAEFESVRRGRRRDEDSSIADMSRSDIGLENVERALRQAATSELNRLSAYLSFLATTGSTAPFIGLFGTVWGIMNSFQAITAMKGAGLEVVGQGISEALIATAVGLAAAIPAVVAYNYFLGVIRVITTDLDNFQAEFMNIIERHYLKRRIMQRRPQPGGSSSGSGSFFPDQ